MNETSYEIAKVYEEQLLKISRIHQDLVAKLTKLCDEDRGVLLRIDYDDKNDRLNYVFEGEDDDFLGPRYERVNSVEEMRKRGFIDVIRDEDDFIEENR